MRMLDPAIADYDDLAELARGAFSTVYRARQRTFDRAVAIKVVTATAGGRGGSRFDRECEAIGRLSGHPGIVTVYEAGALVDGTRYLVMELLTGGTLADALAANGPLDHRLVLRIGVTLAGALESAHRAGVIHGDVKPDNVLLSRYGDPKLADFGLAAVGGHDAGTGGVRGSLPYVAPEVLAGGPPTPAADIYALASTLHALLTGHPPFVAAGQNFAALAASVMADSPADLRPRGVPDSLCRILEMAMAKEPAARQGDAAQMGRQLQAVESQTGHPVTPLVLEGDPPAPAVDGDRARGSPSRPALSTWARVLGAVLLLGGFTSFVVADSEPAVAPVTPLYQDDFEVRSGWHEQDDDSAKVGYESGRYRLVVRRSGEQFLSDTAFRGPVYGPPLTDLRDVSVRVTAIPESGTGLFGVVCRQGPGRASFYEGLLAVDGTVRVLKHDRSGLVPLAVSQAPGPVAGQPVRLRLDCAGPAQATRLRLFIDGRSMIDVIDRSGLDAGSAGVAVATGEAAGAMVAFDDFVLLAGRPAGPGS